MVAMSELFLNYPDKFDKPGTLPPLLRRLLDYSLLMRWDKPIGALLLLWPTLWALWLAGQGQPQQFVVVIFLLGVWIMRSCGCAINDIADREFDPHVERTRSRPLAAGRISLREAVLVFLAMVLLALILVLQLNWLCFWLSLIGLVVAISYPFMKRFHHLPQAHLGIAFGWGVPMAYAALNGHVPFEAWVLFFANMTWVLVYDTEYAMSDREDDLKVGVKSSAILFGARDKQIVGGLQLATVILMVLVGIVNNLGSLYYLGLAAGALTFIYQQYLITERDRRDCFRAFLNNNGFGLAVFCGIVLDLLP